MRAHAAFALLLTAAAAAPKQWYDGLPNVKVLHPHDASQHVVDSVFKEQEKGQFNSKRYALLLTPGVYPPSFSIKVGYYTSVIGVGSYPSRVKLKAVWALNQDGKALNNFWRSVEGVSLWNQDVVWAVSQGAPIRRSIFTGNLHLSERKGYSSGGFVADIKVHGLTNAGTQQQWMFRNSYLNRRIRCRAGWNYVFTGVVGLTQESVNKCGSAMPHKVTFVEETPRIAEKPYIVLDNEINGTGRWQIWVPEFRRGGSKGATSCYGCSTVRKLDLDREVFIAKPGHTATAINWGIAGKKGLLITPGVYHLDDAIRVKRSEFVVLGIGFPTLIATAGQPALAIADELSDVRVAGLLLEAGTPKRHNATTLPLLQWGAHSRKAPAAHGGPSGVGSDIFARVGAFKYLGCRIVRADVLVEINSDGVVLDNVWAWHADHDDCGTDLHHFGKSDRCYSKHGLVVNGHRVTSYGVAAEHIVDGDMVRWNGEEGEAYFFQCELPYHHHTFGIKGHVGYSVAPNVVSHTAYALGVYIIGSSLHVKSAFVFPPYVRASNIMSVVIGGHLQQFGHTACMYPGTRCFKADECHWGMRCVMGAFPHKESPEGKLLVRREGLSREDKPYVGSDVSCDEAIDSWRLKCLMWQPRPSFFILTLFMFSSCMIFGFLRQRRHRSRNPLAASAQHDASRLLAADAASDM